MSSTMPLQNGGWVVAAETPQGTTKQQPAALRRGRRGAALAVVLLLLRVAALCASAASASLAASSAATLLRRAPFRFLLAADAIVAVYSAFEAAAAAWEVARGGATLLPEAMQLWFDFAHDQGFGYMALAAAATAARDVAGCGGGREGWTSGRAATAAACVRADVAVGLGFAGFAFLALAALVTGFRVAFFLATGSRFPLPPPPASY